MLENNLSGVDITNICEVTASRIAIIKSMIELSTAKVTENYIQARTKIGAARKEKVLVTTFIGNLCKLGNHDVDKAIVNAGIIPKILEFIGLFPLNNILHAQVMKIMATLFKERAPSILSDQVTFLA